MLATAAVIVFAPDSAMTYDNFGAAVGVPMVIILPIIAILSVTSEWSQRSGLTTFTLVPKRGEVIWAKLLISVALGAVSIVAALGIGAVGNLVGAGDRRDRPGLGHLLEPGHVAGRGQRARPADRLHARRPDPQLRGGHRGVLHLRLRARRADRRPGRRTRTWFRDLQPWVDFNYTQGMLFEGWPVGGEAWAQLGVTAVGWVVLPLAVGLVLVRRSEVK